MIKSILVPVRGDGMVATVLAHAAELARQHDAQVNVVHCRAQPKDLIPQGIPLPEFARKVMIEQAAPPPPVSVQNTAPFQPGMNQSRVSVTVAFALEPVGN